MKNPCRIYLNKFILWFKLKVVIFYGFRLPNGQPGATPDAMLLKQCPLRRSPDCTGDWERFRTANGECNNPLHPSRGAALMPFRRLLPAAYEDGI
jgi:hypothetical protein